jgi:hypothetical protein
LPTRKQGEYLTTLKGQGGAFTEIFNRGRLFPAGFVWLAEPNTYSSSGAWYQRLSDGDQYIAARGNGIPSCLFLGNAHTRSASEQVFSEIEPLREGAGGDDTIRYSTMSWAA